MSILTNQKLAAQSLQYQKAAIEFKQLARKPIRTADDLKTMTSMFQSNRHNFKLARSKRVEIAFNNLALRESVKRKIASMSSQDSEKWIKGLLKYPHKVLELTGAKQALSDIQNDRAQNAKSIVAFIESVLEFSLKISANEFEGTYREHQKSLSKSLVFLGQTKNAATSKMLELKRKIENHDFESDKQTALEVAMIVIAVVLIVVSIGVAVVTFGAGIAIFFTILGVTANTVEVIVETAPSPDEVVEDTSSKIEECTSKADERRSSCRSLCLPGGAGGDCRAICEASYVADAAACMLL